MGVGATTEHGIVRLEVANPDRRRFAWGAIVPVLVGCVLAVPYLLYIRNPGGDALTNGIAIGFGLVIVAVIVVAMLLRDRAVFQVTDTHVVKRRPLLPPVVVRRSDVAEAIVTPAYAVLGAAGPRLILIDGTSAPLLTSLPLRSMESIEALATVAPWVTRVERLHPREASARWPRAFPWSHRRQGLGVLLGVGIVVAAVLVAVLVIALLGL